MNIDYMVLIQLIFLAIIIFTLYGFAIARQQLRLRNDLIFLEEPNNNHLLDYRERIMKDDLFAFQKYRIWQYEIKKRIVFIDNPTKKTRRKENEHNYRNNPINARTSLSLCR